MEVADFVLCTTVFAGSLLTNRYTTTITTTIVNTSLRQRAKYGSPRMRRNADEVIDLLRVRVALSNNNLKLSVCVAR